MVCENIIIAIQSDIQREGLCAILRDQVSECTIHRVNALSGIIDLFKKYPQAICLFTASDIQSNIDAFLGKLYKITTQPKTCLMVSQDDTNKIKTALRAGVSGLFTQQCSAEEFLKMIKEVDSGKNFYSSAISNTIMMSYQKRYTQRPKLKKHITKRESEILSLIVNGFTSAEIAKKLFISPRTVETHRRNLMVKLKLKNTAELVRFALRGKEF